MALRSWVLYAIVVSIVLLVATALDSIAIGRLWVIGWAIYIFSTLLYILYRWFHQEIEYPWCGSGSAMGPSEMKYIEFVLCKLGTRRNVVWLMLQCATDVYDPKSDRMLIYECRKKIMARRKRRKNQFG